MTTYSPAAPSPRFAHLTAHLGTYVAGVGATAALTAGALVAFLSVATFVAFSGFPFGGSSDDAGSAYLESGLSARANGGGASPSAWPPRPWPTIRSPARVARSARSAAAGALRRLRSRRR